MLLIAQTGVPEIITEFSEQPAAEGFPMMGIVVIAVVVIGVAVTALLVIDRPPTIVNTPMGLMHELCHVHRIKGRSRVVLEQIADSARLDHPASMFLGASQFDAAVAQASKRITLDRKQSATIGLLRRRLFESAA